MPFGWVAAATAGAGLLGAGASQSAGKTQADSANRGQDIQRDQFNLINAQQAPWRQAGQNALGQISGMGDFFNHQFNANDLTANLAPNYEFTKQQGLGAIQNFSTMGGGLFSGNTLKGIADYTTNYAQNSYQNAFNNFTANQSNIFNRLASIAGLGQQANTSVANAGATLAGGQSNAAMAGGAARAAGTVGAYNSISGGLNNAMSWYSLPKIMNMGNNNSGLVQEQVPGQFSLGNPAYG